MCTQHHPVDTTRNYMQVPIYDFDNITPYIKKITDFIDNAIRNEGVVLVHCAMGVNRSVAAILSYLCHQSPISSSEALKVVKNIKSDVNPSAVFLRQIDVFYGREEAEEYPLTTFHRRLEKRKAAARDQQLRDKV